LPIYLDKITIKSKHLVSMYKRISMA